MDALDEIIGHLGAAQIQRAASDDKIIAEHIDAALDAAKRLRGGCSPGNVPAVAVTAERERCAKIAEQYDNYTVDGRPSCTGAVIAAAIRSTLPSG